MRSLGLLRQPRDDTRYYKFGVGRSAFSRSQTLFGNAHVFETLFRRREETKFRGPAFARRLLKYWSSPRCCGFWRWPRRETQCRYPQRSRPSEQRRPAPKSTQPRKARGRRAAGGVAHSLQPHLRGCASLASCHPPFCLYARATPVFQQSPRSLSGFAHGQVVGRENLWRHDL